MKPLEIVAAVFGILGITVSIIIYQQKNRKKLLLWKLCSDIVWMIQYLLLGKLTGAGVCVVGAVRESVFLNKHRRWAQSKLWLLFFLALSIVLSMLTWGSAYSVLPLTASVIAVFSFWRGNPTLTKILAYPICVCMLIYDIFGTGAVSYMGVVNEVLTIVSTTVGIVVSRRAKEQPQKPGEEKTELPEYEAEKA